MFPPDLDGWISSQIPQQLFPFSLSIGRNVSHNGIVVTKPRRRQPVGKEVEQRIEAEEIDFVTGFGSRAYGLCGGCKIVVAEIGLPIAQSLFVPVQIPPP